MALVCLQGASAIGRQQTKSLPIERPHRPEVSLVERQHVPSVVAGGEHDDRGVGEADVEISVPGDNLTGGRHICLTERLEPVDATRDLVEEIQLGGGGDLSRQEVIEFGQDERGEHSRGDCFGKSLGAGGMVTLAAIDGGE